MTDGRFAHEAIASYKGPRVIVSARISAKAALTLEVAAAERRLSRSALAASLLETWAELTTKETQGHEPRTPAPAPPRRMRESR
jgi:hypothetical protein